MLKEMEGRKEKIDISDVSKDLVREKGTGTFGSAYLCKIPSISGECVVKVYKPYLEQDYTPETLKRMLERDGIELEYHKNVVSTLCKIEYDESVTIPGVEKEFSNGMVVMRHCGSNLEKFIRLRMENLRGLDKLFDKELFRMFYGLLNGLKFIHDNKIVHRDIQPGNIFVEWKRGRIWIADFGCCIDLRDGKYEGNFIVYGDDEKLDVLTYPDTSVYSHSPVGNKSFRAPEYRRIIVKNVNNKMSEKDFIDFDKSDSYSVAMVMYWMIEKVNGVSEDNKKLNCHPTLDHLIRRFLNEDPNDRPTLETALKLMEEDIESDIFKEQKIIVHEKRQRVVVFKNYYVRLCLFMLILSFILLFFGYVGWMVLNTEGFSEQFNDRPTDLLVPRIETSLTYNRGGLLSRVDSIVDLESRGCWEEIHHDGLDDESPRCHFGVIGPKQLIRHFTSQYKESCVNEVLKKIRRDDEQFEKEIEKELGEHSRAVDEEKIQTYLDNCFPFSDEQIEKLSRVKKKKTMLGKLPFFVVHAIDFFPPRIRFRDREPNITEWVIVTDESRRFRDSLRVMRKECLDRKKRRLEEWKVKYGFFFLHEEDINTCES